MKDESIEEEIQQQGKVVASDVLDEGEEQLDYQDQNKVEQLEGMFEIGFLES